MKRLFISIIKFYQKYISSRRPPCCRFYPTCSQYGLQAVERYGAFVGGFMTLWRILRCNPFVPGGFDPVPEKIKGKKFKKIKYKSNDKQRFL